MNNDYIKHTFPEWTNLLPYNSQSNMYEIPADGYVDITGSGTKTGIFVCSNSTGAPYVNISVPDNQNTALFVKKGMYVWQSGGTREGYVCYRRFE